MDQRCRSGRRGVVFIVVLGVLIGSALLAYAAFAARKSNRSIRQVAVIFRHGDRTPTETYVNDPYRNYSWEGGWGALTTKGMQQLYQLGQWIRSEYNTVIAKKFSSPTTYVLSSDADRCIMSAQALLAALFRPDAGDHFYDDLPWYPVPVHTIPRNVDKLITVKYQCPALEYALKEAYINETLKTGKEMASYYARLSYHTGQKVSTITDVEFLYNTLEIEDQHGLDLPPWTKRFYNSTMREIAAKSLAIFTSNPTQRRLRGGPLLKEITNNMMLARNDQTKKTLFLYSAHDITLVNVLRAMGFTRELFKPDYGAALIFELVVAEEVEQNLELDVIVKYLNSSQTNDAVTLEIPGCKEPCKLLKLLSVWRDILPDNWDAECLKLMS